MNTSGTLPLILSSLLLGYFFGKILLSQHIDMRNFSKHNWISWAIIGLFFDAALLAVAMISLPEYFPFFNHPTHVQFLADMASKAIPALTVGMIVTLSLKPEATAQMSVSHS